MTVLIDIVLDDDDEFTALETIASFRPEDEAQKVRWDQRKNSLPDAFNTAVEVLYNRGHRVFIIQAGLDDYVSSHSNEIAWSTREIDKEVKVIGLDHV